MTSSSIKIPSRPSSLRARCPAMEHGRAIASLSFRRGSPKDRSRRGSNCRRSEYREEPQMSTLASFIVTSLDGFYEGPNGEFDWLVPDQEFNDFAARQLDEADTLGFGRATYEHMAAWWPTEQAQINDPAITSRMNAKPKLVFSTTLDVAGWSNTTIIAGEAVEQIETVKAAPGAEYSGLLQPVGGRAPRFLQ